LGRSHGQSAADGSESGSRDGCRKRRDRAPRPCRWLHLGPFRDRRSLRAAV